jgi:hypothetical protein
MTMNKDQIEKVWENKKFALCLEIDALCIERVKTLVHQMKPFRITELLCGNGTCTILGDDFEVEYDDGSRGPKKIVELWYYGMYRDFCWTPVNMNPRILEVLYELVDLCTWWTDTTGGGDVRFDN